MDYKEDIKKAIEVMNRGGVILYPTDTVWGLGCDATNVEAVKRVYDIKKIIDSKALIILVDSEVKVQFYVSDVPEVAWDLLEMSSKPLTVIYDGARNLVPDLIAEDGSVGIRITNEEFSKQLCYRFRKAIVSTSANISGAPTPLYFDDITDDIKDAVDYICTSRQNEMEKCNASSIIKLRANNEVKIIRK